MKNDKYWVWLTTMPGLGMKKISDLLEIFGTAENIYKAKNYGGIYGMTGKLLDGLCDKSMERVYKILDKVSNSGAAVVTPDDEQYPPLLRHISDPPFVLYAKGVIPDWDNILPIAMVGTRRCGEYGINSAKAIASGLAHSGVTIVSGMAHGIDAVCETTALNEGGEVISVLGCGIDVIYPRDNTELYAMSAENGLILTEYPPGTKPIGRNFPRRNRIIAGLSRGVVVGEAPADSGALITAYMAADYGRDVFVIPGSIFENNFRGNFQLMGEGALPIRCAEDVMESYRYDTSRIQPGKPSARKKSSKKRDKREQGEEAAPTTREMPDLTSLSPLSAKIVESLFGEAMIDDELSRKLGVPAGDVCAELIMLEIDGIIQKRKDNKYCVV